MIKIGLEKCPWLFFVSILFLFFCCQFPSSGSDGQSRNDLPVAAAPDTSLCKVRGEISTDTPTFTWSSVPKATSYTLYVINADDQSLVLRDMNIRGDDSSYTPEESLPQKVNLQWTVKGENKNGPGPYSPLIGFKITETGNGFNASGNPPVFEWPSMDGATYWLLVGDDGDVGSSNWFVDQRDLASNLYTAPGKFPAGQTCYWKVKYKAGPFESWYWSPIMTFTIPGEPAIPSHRQIAEFYAPVIYQDVDTEGNCDHADKGRADYITNVNFDGDWLARNNWENEPGNNLKAYVYYSVVESTKRYYITYAVFHPRDYCNESLILDPLLEHENDMEGLWMSVYKNGSFYGNLEAMVTAAHYDFYQFSNYDVEGVESIDGCIIAVGGKPCVFIECRGHGIRGNGSFDFGGDDGVVYKYSGTAQQPVNVIAHRTYSSACTYDLVHIDELWERRPGGVLYAPDTLFYDCTHYLGDGEASSCHCNLNDNSPNPPWGWDDNDDSIGRGVYFTAPDYYFDYAFNLENISGHSRPISDPYTYHPYRNP